MPTVPFSDIIDRHYPPGTPARRAHDATMRRMRRKDRLLGRLLNWMYALPPRWPVTEPDDAMTIYHGLGPLMQAFWWAYIDEGFYGSLDMLSFHYFDDAYVPTLRQWRQRKVLQLNWRAHQGAARGEAKELLAEYRAEQATEVAAAS